MKNSAKATLHGGCTIKTLGSTLGSTSGSTSTQKSAAAAQQFVFDGTTPIRVKVAEKPLQGTSRVIGVRYSLLDYSIARTVLGNMGSWSAVGIESGSIGGSCLWDADLIKWAMEVEAFFKRLFATARVFLRANKGLLRWCDCLAQAWKSIGRVKYLTEKLGHAVNEFRPIQAIRSYKGKLKNAAERVIERMYRNVYFNEPAHDAFVLSNGVRLKKYDI
jgi:hypothetical protein